MAEPLVVVQLTTVRSRSCTPSLHIFTFPAWRNRKTRLPQKQLPARACPFEADRWDHFLFGAVAQWKSAPLIRAWSMDRSHPALPPGLVSYTHVAGIAQRQSNRLLTGGSRFRNSLPAPSHQTPSSEAEQRPYKATVGISKFPGSTTLHSAAGGIGRRSALRAPCPKGHAGSTPAPRTTPQP
jgi:hypothetical protein